jgi:hypothetical protein
VEEGLLAFRPHRLTTFGVAGFRYRREPVAHDDLISIATKRAELYPTKAEREFELWDLGRIARRLVRQNWHAISAVAEALLGTSTVSGANS